MSYIWSYDDLLLSILLQSAHLLSCSDIQKRVLSHVSPIFRPFWSILPMVLTPIFLALLYRRTTKEGGGGTGTVHPLADQFRKVVIGRHPFSAAWLSSVCNVWVSLSDQLTAVDRLYQSIDPCGNNVFVLKLCIFHLFNSLCISLPWWRRQAPGFLPPLGSSGVPWLPSRGICPFCSIWNLFLFCFTFARLRRYILELCTTKYTFVKTDHFEACYDHFVVITLSKLISHFEACHDRTFPQTQTRQITVKNGVSL